MSRKLASVQRIKAIKPIEGADRIEIVQVLNWNCVAKKGEYQVGDTVIYFEIDSLLPDIPAFEWLKGSSWSQKLNKYKISTHKFRGQISQGLVIPITQLGELLEQIKPEGYDCLPSWMYMENGFNIKDWIDLDGKFALEGVDLTETLTIEKYEPPVSNGPLGDLIHHEWYVPKTDEERIQVCAENVLPVYMNADKSDWYASIKLDGCSCTAGLFADGYLCGGRNQWYKGPNMYTETVRKYTLGVETLEGDLEYTLKEYQKQTGKYVVFQGELCGPGIQSNRLGLSEKEWFIFNVFVSDTGEMDSYTKVGFDEMIDFCEIFCLNHVPVIPLGLDFKFDKDKTTDETVEDLLSYVDNIKYRTYFGDAAPGQTAEGVVFRMKDMTNSFKVVSNKYLLKGGE